MPAPTKGALTLQTQVHVLWSDVNFTPNNGDSDIINYNVQWDRGTLGKFWYNLIGSSTNSLTTSYIVTNGIVPGDFYLFKVRAQNKWGYGPFSPVFSIQASTIPDKLVPPTTSLNTANGAVVISWIKPNDRNNAIDMYTIEVLSAVENDKWYKTLATCDGEKSEIIVQNRQCTVPMETLLQAPFSYPLSAVIKARVAAHNMNGWGLVSDPNVSGVTAKTKPIAMLPVTRGIETTEKQIKVNWVTQTTEIQIGGSVILTYNLQWDKGTGNEDWADLIGFPGDSLLTTYTVTAGLVKGKNYRFRLRSKNIYGFGDFSTIFTIRSSEEPEMPAPVTTTISDVNVVISWIAPYDNSEVIDEYDLQIRKADNLTWLNDLVHCPRKPTSPTSCVVPMKTLRTDFGLT